MGKSNIQTIKQLHKKTGLSHTIISNLINGHKKSIRVDTIIKLCQTFNCEIGELVVIEKEKVQV